MLELKELTFDELVDETVEGVYQVLSFMRSQTGSVGMDKVYAAGTDGRHKEAHTWILEFIKDGITKDLIDESQDKTLSTAHLKNFTIPYLRNFFPEETANA